MFGMSSKSRALSPSLKDITRRAVALSSPTVLAQTCTRRAQRTETGPVFVSPCPAEHALI